jgi:hypothetical protein
MSATQLLTPEHTGGSVPALVQRLLRHHGVADVGAAAGGEAPRLEEVSKQKGFVTGRTKNRLSNRTE